MTSKKKHARQETKASSAELDDRVRKLADRLREIRGKFTKRGVLGKTGKMYGVFNDPQ